MQATEHLRQLLRTPGIIVVPGAYNCLSVKLIAQPGFPALYMTGAGTALTRLGAPDLGFATRRAMVANAAADPRCAGAAPLPRIMDARP